MDVFKRRAHLIYGSFMIEDWEEEVRNVWQACLEHNIGIEINTGGMRWQINETHPNLAALRWYREMGGVLLTVGSDAHHPQDLGFGLDHALALARSAGFKALARYEKREVVSMIPI
jgi:histidinol-phosphatase (PHP family)